MLFSEIYRTNSNVSISFISVLIFISIFQSFNISISISLPHNRRVPSFLGKKAKGQPFIVIWPSGEYVAGYVERVWSVVSPG